MTWIVTWLSALPLLVALIAATFVPGWLLLVAGGARFRLARIACAPALTFLLMGLGGVLFRGLGVWWHLPTIITYLFLCAAVVVVGRWAVGQAQGPGAHRCAPGSPPNRPRTAAGAQPVLQLHGGAG